MDHADSNRISRKYEADFVNRASKQAKKRLGAYRREGLEPLNLAKGLGVRLCASAGVPHFSLLSSAGCS